MTHAINVIGFVGIFQDFIVSVLLSPCVERFSGFHMQHFSIDNVFFG